VGIYGSPYIVVDAAQPKRTVTFFHASESDPVGYPIPDEAITQPHWVEGGEPGNQNVPGDRHELIVDKDNKYLYELHHTFLTIPAGATASTNTAALVTPRNATGTARLTHDGPPDALLAEAAIANFSTSPAYIQPVKFGAVRQSR
jgi:hypothetical protein